MIHSRQVIVDKMRSWVGCHEGDATHKHIVDTYNAHKPLARGYKVKYTDAWCATTVSAAAIEVGYTDIIPTECSCNKLIEKFQKMGIWVENDAYIPSAGDWVFYDWQDSGVGDNVGTSEHVGMVESYNGKQIVVIEGNKSDAVGRRVLAVNGRYIRGYGVPKYDAETVVKPINTATTSLSKIKKGALGIDVSANQGNIDFHKVKADGYDFVILRSTTKNLQADKKFEKYFTDATNAGLIIAGVYKYSYAKNVVEALAEADSVIKLLNGRKVDIWLDMEDKSQIIYGKDGIAAIITSFLTHCVKNGYEVGIYCNQTWYNNYIKDDIKKICRFWIARYGKNDGTMQSNCKPNVGEVMWQYTSHGRVDGIEGNVDINVRC